MPHLQHVVIEAAKGRAAAAATRRTANARQLRAHGSVAHRSAPEGNVRLSGGYSLDPTNQTKAGLGLYSRFGTVPQGSSLDDVLAGTRQEVPAGTRREVPAGTRREVPAGTRQRRRRVPTSNSCCHYERPTVGSKSSNRILVTF